MNLQVLGFKGEISSVGDTLSQINSIKKDDEIIQLLNADAVAGRRHIEHGVNQAFLAFSRGENLANDLIFIREFKPHMVGMGPFIPHKDTPFRDAAAGSLEDT